MTEPTLLMIAGGDARVEEPLLIGEAAREKDPVALGFALTAFHAHAAWLDVATVYLGGRAVACSSTA